MNHLFGIRHHGPGCARSLLRALQSLQPDCLLVEGPPEAEEVLWAVLNEGMEPPVALLLYCPDEVKLSSFYPFAEFSPEWQAIRYAMQAGIPVRFIDLPQVHDLALRKQENDVAGVDGGDSPAGALEAGQTPEGESAIEVEEDVSADPLDWLGRAAGYGDGETWWNEMVEERGDGGGVELFEAIAEAMTTVRAEVPRRLGKRSEHREALREAHMRKCLRAAEKEGFEKIAVVCGAWHVPALAKLPAAKVDNDLLKGLPKVKVAATWAPWTYGRLATASGYGAGVESPGWYEFLWKNEGRGSEARSIGWISKVARLMREEDVDCSSAHVIEAARLAETLAAMRERPAAGLEELNEALRTVVCMGDDAALGLVREKLIVGERLGRVPADVPTVPLQQDMERQQRSLRMKPEAVVKELDLDLRKENDLARSQLLHRLALLGIKWGEVRGTGRSSKGTFHEVWQLQWQPEFAINLIEASRWGQTIEDAATAWAVDKATREVTLPGLSALVDAVLLANLPGAVEPVTKALENQAAMAGDASQLLDAIPPLANVYRYGNVRQTDAAQVGHVLEGLVMRGCIGLGGACASLDDEAAVAMRDRLVKVQRALKLIGNDRFIEEWLAALKRLTVGSTHGLVAGLAARVLFDEHEDDADATAQRLSLALSAGNDPSAAAAWLEGFLHQSGMVLLHDEALWETVNAWVAGLSEDHFTQILPLVRRTFAMFPPTERQQMGERAKRSSTGAVKVVSIGGSGGAEEDGDDFVLERAESVLPVLRQILGLGLGGDR